MKSSNKKMIEEDGELLLEITIEENNSELFEKLIRIITTHKLLKNSGKRIKYGNI